MAIQIIDGFQTNISELGTLLVIESDRLNEYLEYAKDKGITRISMQRNFGYKLDNVDFLKEYIFFTSVTIGEYIDISSVHYLKNLECLFLVNGKHPIDFIKFPHLKECSIYWNNKIVGLDSANCITSLTIRKFKPKSKDFTDLSGCKKVEYLHITESNIESLDGIEKLKCLTHLEASYMSKLGKLNGLEKLSSHLKVLELNTCKNLKEHEDILKGLKNAEKIILSNCGDLKSLDFIRSLPKLKFISFVRTNVLDGDMTPTLELEYAGYDDKRHYSHKMRPLK